MQSGDLKAVGGKREGMEDMGKGRVRRYATKEE